MWSTVENLLSRSETRKFLTYAICGGVGVSLDILLFAFLLTVGCAYQLANVVGYSSGTLMSFFLNRHLTFRIYDNTLIRLILFFGAAAVGYGLTAILLWLLIERLYLNPLNAKLLSLMIVLIVQFCINRAVAFRQRWG